MLYEIDKYLENNEISYSIISGTMLGAIRHNGFIPWDDDIDIGILRSDYNKLVKLLRENCYITENLFGTGFEIDEGEWPFIKIYNKNISVIEEGVSKEEKLWIDIFPFDGVPQKKYNLYFKVIKNFRRVYHKKRIMHNVI